MSERRTAPVPGSLGEARELDAADPLHGLRHHFERPKHPAGGDVPVVYMCGNSLGLMPKDARDRIAAVLDTWAGMGVGGHFDGDPAWYRYDEQVSVLQAPLVGAQPGEVALAGSLTVDLHLLMATFYRPTGKRRKILVEVHAFPSDRYAVRSQAAWHGLDPDEAVVEVPPDGRGRFTASAFEEALERHADEVALVLLGGVNYLTGEVLDMGSIAAGARRAGAVVGLDLAHAAGNVPCRLPDWDVDFAAWCTYKYLNGGPGSVAGYFVHRRHGENTDLPRLAGWWGNDPDHRFRMQEERRFVPRPGADGWKVSNPPVLALAPLDASLRLFAEVGIDTLRERSSALTGALHALASGLPGVEVLTPAEPAARGAQVSVRVAGAAAVQAALAQRGVMCDHRDPDVVRLAPAPLYNGWEDVWRAAAALAESVRER